MNKREFGALLLGHLESKPFEVQALSRWAYQVYLDNSRTLEPGLKEVLLDIARMEDGEEFEFTRSELLDLAVSMKNT
jgi:hypothetical protein